MLRTLPRGAVASTAFTPRGKNAELLYPTVFIVLLFSVPDCFFLDIAPFRIKIHRSLRGAPTARSHALQGIWLFRDIRIPGFAPRSMDTLFIKGRALVDRCTWNPGVILSCDVEGGYHHALLHQPSPELRASRVFQRDRGIGTLPVLPWRASGLRLWLRFLALENGHPEEADSSISKRSCTHHVTFLGTGFRS